MHIPNPRRTTTTAAAMPVPALFRPATDPRPVDQAAPRPLGPKPTPVTFSDTRGA